MTVGKPSTPDRRKAPAAAGPNGMKLLAKSRIAGASVFLALILAATLAPQRAGAQDPWGPRNRDAWQRPEEVMDALGLKPGSVVADVGCGRGYFTFHLADRVGSQGKVYAVDVKEHLIAGLRHEAEAKTLSQIEAVVGAADDPHLPLGALDAILVVDAYHEMHDYDAMLEAFYRALKPGGLLGVIDIEAERGQRRNTYFEHHNLPAEIVREDATRHQFRFLHNEPGFTVPKTREKHYFLLFEKPNN
jgi:ubiquinone/menaquinone biosynthesis C-methylase UbiE